jgi:hypothetical protein
MEQSETTATQQLTSKIFGVDFPDDLQKPFELLLSNEQVKQLQKLLPVGYSFAIPNKNTRQAHKKAIVKELTREESAQTKSNAERQKRKAYREAEQTIRGTGEFVKRCKQIIEAIRKHPSADPFLRPVDPIALRIPDYFDIIKEPMDLSTVNRKLMEDMYPDQETFETDVRRIWSNAFTYNLPGTQIYMMTEDMSKYFERLLVEENPRVETCLSQFKPQSSKVPKRVEYDEPNPPRFKTSHSIPKGLLDKPLSYSEKKNLSHMIRQLPSECLWDVWKIVAPNNENHGNEELEFDIDTLPAKTARELEAFVKSKVSQTRKKTAPKRVGSTNDFNIPGSYANIGVSRQESSNQPIGGPINNTVPSYDHLPSEAPARPGIADAKNGGDDGDDESSFISSLDESDY